MFEQTPDMSCLRQGDIIRGVYLPRYSLVDTDFLHAMDDDGALTFKKRAVVSVDQRFAVVLSQCCEFNEGKRNAFSIAVIRRFGELFGPRVFGVNLAEVVPISRSVFRSVEDLREANRIVKNGPNRAVNVYQFDADGTFFKEPFLADFSQVVSVKMNSLDRIRASKILQLTPEIRREFQKKVAYFYGRRVDG